jgi:hypothetical protein
VSVGGAIALTVAYSPVCDVILKFHLPSQYSPESRRDFEILNTQCEHNVAVTVASELCPVIRFLPHTAALPFLGKKNSLAFLLDLYPYFPNIPRIIYYIKESVYN